MHCTSRTTISPYTAPQLTEFNGPGGSDPPGQEAPHGAVGGRGGGGGGERPGPQAQLLQAPRPCLNPGQTAQEQVEEVVGFYCRLYSLLFSGVFVQGDFLTGLP